MLRLQPVRQYTCTSGRTVCENAKLAMLKKSCSSLYRTILSMQDCYLCGISNAILNYIFLVEGSRAGWISGGMFKERWYGSVGMAS